ncbi:MAG: NAD-dependent epimerase/dehydratase family protein [Actinomycetota bacterium]
MKVFMTGATGAIGPATIRALRRAGHEVRAVARGPEKAELVRELGAEPVAVDLFDAAAVKEAVAGSEAVLHLATNVPPVSRAAKKSAWATHNALRTTATEYLVQAALDAGARTFVKESITFVYPDRGDAWIDEDVPADESIGMLAPTLEGERIALRFDGDGRAAVVLRFGLFYGPDTRHTEESLRMARRRLSTVAGKKGAYMTSVHTDDVGTAVAAALDAPTGIYNVGDDEPLTRRDYLDAFREAFGLGWLFSSPSWLMRLIAGKASKVLTASQRCSNRRFREATGWAPAYPSAREGWAASAAARAKEKSDA